MSLTKPLIYSLIGHACLLAFQFGDTFGVAMPSGARLDATLTVVSNPLPSGPSDEGLPVTSAASLEPVIRSKKSSSPKQSESAGLEDQDNSSPKPAMLPVVEHYYPLEEVTRRPQVVENINFSPPDLEALDGSGKMILVLYISKYGNVDRVETLDSDLANPIEAIVIKEFSTMKFSSAEKDGEPVGSRMRIEVVLNPRADKHGSSK